MIVSQENSILTLKYMTNEKENQFFDRKSKLIIAFYYTVNFYKNQISQGIPVFFRINQPLLCPYYF